MYIPLGIGAYYAITKATQKFQSNRKMSFSYKQEATNAVEITGEEIAANVRREMRLQRLQLPIALEKVSSNICAARKLGDSCKNELASELSFALSNAALPDATFRNGYIVKKSRIRQALAAKFIYENAILNGSYRLQGSFSCRSLLKKQNLLWDYSSLMSPKAGMTLLYFTSFEKEGILSDLQRFDKRPAAILLMLLCNSMVLKNADLC